MGMFGEIATEGTIEVIVKEIKADLERSKNKPAECRALRRIGRFALQQFDSVFPDWAREYSQLFSEQHDR